MNLPPSRDWFYFPCRLFCRLVVRAFGPIRVHGVEHLPRKGAVIIASNHISYLDPPVIGIVAPRRLRYMAKQELFRYRLPALILRNVGVFPVRRGEIDLEAIRIALELLKQGEGLVIFPEGTRSEDGRLGEANAGVGMLAKRSGAMVVPACVIGTDAMMPRDSKFFHRSQLTVAFGPPLTYVGFVGEGNEQDGRLKFGVEVMRRIQALLDEHRGPVASAAKESVG